MTSQEATPPPFTVYARRMAVGAVGLVDANGGVHADVEVLACEPAQTFQEAAEIARSLAARHGYPADELEARMEWAEQCCTGQAGTVPAFHFGQPGVLPPFSSQVTLSIDAAEYIGEMASVAGQIRGHGPLDVDVPEYGYAVGTLRDGRIVVLGSGWGRPSELVFPTRMEADASLANLWGGIEAFDEETRAEGLGVHYGQVVILPSNSWSMEPAPDPDAAT